MATRKGPVWKGSKALTQQPDSPKFRHDKNGPVWTYTYRGPYAVVVAARPERLATFQGLPAGFSIDTVAIDKEKGGVGVLTFTATVLPLAGFDANGYPQNAEDVLEVEWVEIQKKLETHPRYVGAGAKALTGDDLNQIEAWKDGRDAVLRAAFKFKADDGTETTLSANAQDFAGKVLRGTDSFVVYVPLIRVTTKSRTRPDVQKCGVKDNPPAGAAVAGYQYLRTADRRTRQDREWTRVREWTGADTVDLDLYPAAA